MPTARSYPLIHPTASCSVFGDTIDKLTDATGASSSGRPPEPRTTLCYLVTSEEASPFIGALVPTAEQVVWHSMAAVTQGPEAMVEVRVYDAYDVHESLKNPFGFRFDASSEQDVVRFPSC